MSERTRIEGGAVICRYCNRVLTFNFIERPAGACGCRASSPSTTPGEPE